MQNQFYKHNGHFLSIIDILVHNREGALLITYPFTPLLSSLFTSSHACHVA